MYGFNAHRLEISPLIPKDNSPQKEFRFEVGQLPDQLVKSQIGEENAFVFRVGFFFVLLCFYLLYRPADLFCILSVQPFLPANTP